MRVVIADDHRLILDGVRRALETDGGFEIVGETQNGKDVLDLVGKTSPDMVLLDVRMPELDGLDCLDQLRAAVPRRQGRDAVGVDEPRPGRDCAPARCERLRREERRSGRPAVDAAPGGERHGVLEPCLADLLGAVAGDAAGLTEREIAILAALARGLSNDQIAKEMWVARQTVKFHLTNVYRKLGVKSRTEAIHRAYQLGLVERPAVDERYVGSAVASATIAAAGSAGTVSARRRSGKRHAAPTTAATTGTSSVCHSSPLPIIGAR